MTQYDAILTVWCTRDRVDIVLKFPTVGDSTPEINHNSIYYMYILDFIVKIENTHDNQFRKGSRRQFA